MPEVRTGERRVVAIVGATATGKTGVSLRVARALGAEIVCVDSRQVFRELDIGTGKPTPVERDSIPHHLFDARTLEEPTNAGWYAGVAAEAIRGVHERGRPVVLVGGTGLYLRALQTGLSQHPPGEPEVRADLERRRRQIGNGALHAELAAHDPVTAARLSPGDAQRVMRALEVLIVSGRPLSWWHERPPEPAVDAEWSVFELVADPDASARAIESRTRAMLDQGLIEETRSLLDAGRGEALRALRAIGYDESLDCIAGRLSRQGALDAICLRTRQLAKRQRTWFRHQTRATRIDAAGRDAAGALLAGLRVSG